MNEKFYFHYVNVSISDNIIWHINVAFYFPQKNSCKCLSRMLTNRDLVFGREGTTSLKVKGPSDGSALGSNMYAMDAKVWRAWKNYCKCPSRFKGFWQGAKRHNRSEMLMLKPPTTPVYELESSASSKNHPSFH